MNSVTLRGPNHLSDISHCALSTMQHSTWRMNWYVHLQEIVTLRTERIHHAQVNHQSADVRTEDLWNEDGSVR